MSICVLYARTDGDGMTEETLRELVAALSKKEKEQITAATSLESLLPGSLGRTRLDAALRYKLGISNRKIYHATTFGDLCNLLAVPAQNGTLQAATAQEPVPLPPLPSFTAGNGAKKIRAGIDLEPIAALPEAQDYWDDDFYKHTFTVREIGYALLQPSPRASFAAAWCAKEALRKAEPSVAELPWTALEVVHDAAGEPSMAVEGKPVEGALSLAHSGEMAAAIFVAAELSQSAPASNVPAPASSGPADAAEQRTAGGGRSFWVVLIAVLALLLSIAAFAATFFRR